MEVTATIDLRPATSSEVGAYDRHVEHDPNENHANKMIVKSDRELNVYHVLNDENQVLKEQYGDYLAERNAKLENDFKAGKISTDQYTSRKQTVQEYVNGSNGSKEKKAYTSAVLTVADGETQKDMLDKLGWDYQMIGVGDQQKNGKYEHYRPQLTGAKQRETWSRLWDMTYTQTAKDIDNDSFRVISVATNLDEGGGAHAHLKFVNMGQTAGGKPSTTMNGALKAMYDGKDSRDNLRKFRDQFDPLMIDNFNKSAETLGLNLHLDMIRTREAGSVDMPTYKAHKKREKELQVQAEQVEKAQKANKVDADNNARWRMRLLQRQDDLEKREKQLFQREIEFEYEKAGQEEAYDQRIQQVKRRERDNAARERELNRREQELKRREFKQQIAEQQTREFADMMGIPTHGDNVFETIIKYVRNIKNAILRKNQRKIQLRRDEMAKGINNQTRAYMDVKNASSAHIKPSKHKDDGPDL